MQRVAPLLLGRHASSNLGLRGGVNRGCRALQAVRTASGESRGREPTLFTPGPLTTSAAVKQAMLVDYGSRDKLFTGGIIDVRNGLLRAAGTSQANGHECVIVQGSGTMAVEAVLGSVIPRDGGKVLIVINGAYGHRQVTICRYLGIECDTLEYTDSEPWRVDDILKRLREAQGSFTHVSVIHHETSAGIISPLEALARAQKAQFPEVGLLVDSMSGFGAYDLQMDWGIDFAVSSANKCIEGVPGFSFALCNRAALERTKGNARSLSFDLFEQWSNMEKTGQFRFTPPTHALVAFRQALLEWENEGGVVGRAARYRANYEVLKRGMEEMGFKFYVTDEDCRSILISTFIMPEHPNFKFQEFYDFIASWGMVIYPGKLAQGDSFRFGSIGRVFPHDCELLVAATREACKRMNVPLPLK
eukprot:TRINITY_DN4141_c0_g1_i2.p1 TRINITY_DN4141_c0_g1~~TRINITY_DN4141_c0_g1_i2.p1  ORF type:complete len:417 (-),score=56.97 TRINITY_DN4141_c0_g1_i2:41-1291(-)